MYTTLSPCDMCTGACLLYGISRVVIGENSTFLGGEAYLRLRGVEVIVLNDAPSRELMERFISESPELWFVFFRSSEADRVSWLTVLRRNEDIGVSKRVYSKEGTRPSHH